MAPQLAHAAPQLVHVTHVLPAPHLPQAPHLPLAPYLPPVQHLPPAPLVPPPPHVLPPTLGERALGTRSTLVAPAPHVPPAPCAAVTFSAPPVQPPVAGVARPIALVAPPQPVAHVAPARRNAKRAAERQGGPPPPATNPVSGRLSSSFGFVGSSAFTPVSHDSPSPPN